MTDPTLSARFRDARDAGAAVDALVAAGIARENVLLEEQDSSAASEGRFLWRLVVTIIFWSIPGGLIGAGAGFALALGGVGPGGATGTAVQVITLMIAGHLLAGMWAGYASLVDRGGPQMAPDRPGGVVVSVRCEIEAHNEMARQILRSLRGRGHGPA